MIKIVERPIPGIMGDSPGFFVSIDDEDSTEYLVNCANGLCHVAYRDGRGFSFPVCGWTLKSHAEKEVERFHAARNKTKPVVDPLMERIAVALEGILALMQEQAK